MSFIVPEPSLDFPFDSTSTSLLVAEYGEHFYFYSIIHSFIAAPMILLETGNLRRYLVTMLVSNFDDEHKVIFGDKTSILVCNCGLTDEAITQLINYSSITTELSNVRSLFVTLDRLLVDSSMFTIPIYSIVALFLGSTREQELVDGSITMSKWTNSAYMERVQDFFAFGFTADFRLEAIPQYLRHSPISIHKPIRRLNSVDIDILVDIYRIAVSHKMGDFFLSELMTTSQGATLLSSPRVKNISFSRKPSNESLEKCFKYLFWEEQRVSIGLKHANEDISTDLELDEPFLINRDMAHSLMPDKIREKDPYTLFTCIGVTEGPIERTFQEGLTKSQTNNSSNIEECNNNNASNANGQIDASLFISSQLPPYELENPGEWTTLDYYLGFPSSLLDLTDCYLTGSAIPACFLNHPLFPSMSARDTIDLFYPRVTNSMAKSGKEIGILSAKLLGDKRNQVTMEDFMNKEEAIRLLSNRDPNAPKKYRYVKGEEIDGADIDIGVSHKLNDGQFKDKVIQIYTIVSRFYPNANLKIETKPGGGTMATIGNCHRIIQIYQCTIKQIMTHHVAMVRGFVTDIKLPPSTTSNVPPIKEDDPLLTSVSELFPSIRPPSPQSLVKPTARRQCYLSASCLTAALTGKTPNYYYFAGKQSKAIDVILKYLRRGWGMPEGFDNANVYSVLYRHCVETYNVKSLRDLPYSFPTLKQTNIDSFNVYLRNIDEITKSHKANNRNYHYEKLVYTQEHEDEIYNAIGCGVLNGIPEDDEDDTIIKRLEELNITPRI